jgi:hypothetical protein
MLYRTVLHFKGNHMKHAKLTLSLIATLGLAALSVPMLASAESVKAPVVPVAQVTKYSDADVNDAASAYVSLYKQTIDQSLTEQKYKSELAFKYLSAEACLDSRAARLLAKDLSREEKKALVLASVSKQQIAAYEALSQGHYVRVNGLELFSCDHAGLKGTQFAMKN